MRLLSAAAVCALLGAASAAGVAPRAATAPAESTTPGASAAQNEGNTLRASTFGEGAPLNEGDLRGTGITHGASATYNEGAVLGTNATLDDYVSYALERNPFLRSYADLHDAMKWIPAQRRALPDPTLSFGYFARSIETRVGPQEQVWMLQQKFPFFGKLSLKGQIAEREASIAGETYRDQANDLVEKVKRAYFDYYHVYRLIEIAKEEKKILLRMQDVAQVKYASGQVGQQDVLKAQLSHSAVEDDLTKLERARVGVTARLNNLLNRDPDAPLAIPRADVPEADLGDIERYYDVAEAHRPELSAAALAEEKAAKAKSLAKRQYFPDLALSMQYVRVDERPVPLLEANGRDALLFSASINLPIWFHKLSAGVKEAEARIALARHRKESVRTTIRSDVQDAHARVRTAVERVILYRDVMIPQAEQVFRASEAGYQTGKIDFLSYLDSERMLLGVRKMHVEAVADLGRQIAHFERMIGVELDEIGM
ncbi:MAG: TolC family protein [Candidatus Latescibacteria bacterium]|nr:TolC family protein [Candidatus Latescibacterota bacterium]NIM22402.1 TolC family protein [Candidatus Latescibacterota bacterium]NIM64762.1 TolC family protein [Candidatus Latescibacterota bacterium]NIO01273.1 TolC family protein [Candidatus Latescibacterota bacterium]NIO78606.1 TolC family protein [Candidatus Latescibacterota bacterium]